MLLLIGAVHAMPPAEMHADPEYKPPGTYDNPTYDEPPTYEADKYKTKCSTYYETEYKEKCEPYQDKICYTTQEEDCVDLDGRMCKAIVSTKQERQCVNVTELICHLRESVQYEVVQAVFSVQKCYRATERVCDTVYEAMVTPKDDYQCIMLTNPKCYPEDEIVYDKTCRTTTHHDCTYETPSYGSPYEAPSYGGDGDYPKGDDYPAKGGEYKEDDYKGDGDDYGSSYKCKRSYDTKCYTTPRTVTSKYCEPKEEKHCEKLAEQTVIAVEKQVCHDEYKKVCELEQRSQPKQVKKYVYTKHCRPVEKTVCESIDRKDIEPSCVDIKRQKCYYKPVEKCEEVPKQYCHKIPIKVQKQKCEAYKDPYTNSHDTSYYE